MNQPVVFCIHNEMKWNPFSFRQKKKLKFQDESSEFLYGTQKKKNINCKHALGFFLLMCHYIHILYFIWHFLCVYSGFICFIYAEYSDFMEYIGWYTKNNNNRRKRKFSHHQTELNEMKIKTQRWWEWIKHHHHHHHHLQIVDIKF